MDIAGNVAPGFERVRDAFATGHSTDPGGAQLSVYHRGEQVVDLWTVVDSEERGTFGGDSLGVIWSSTKGALAICMAMLVERGLLDVEAPVSRYWPEFGVNGKENATTTHLLAHNVGLPDFPSASGIRGVDYGDRDRCIATLAAAAPLWEPGTTRGTYHALTYGFLVSEVLRRITGGTEGGFFAENVAKPLGLDFWIGLPAEHEPRVWPRSPWGDAPTATLGETWSTAGVDVKDPVAAEMLAGAELYSDLSDYFNTREGHAVEVPAANGIANARSIARMYAATIGEVDGVRLISPETVEFVRASRLRGLPTLPALDALGPGTDRGLGFWLADPPGTDFLGTLIPGSFGHPGAGGQHGFAHPGRSLAVGYTCTSMYQGGGRDPRSVWADALSEVVPAGS